MAGKSNLRRQACRQVGQCGRRRTIFLGTTLSFNHERPGSFVFLLWGLLLYIAWLEQAGPLVNASALTAHVDSSGGGPHLSVKGSDHTWSLASEVSLQDEPEGLSMCVNECEQGLAGLGGLLDTSAVNFVGEKVTERLLANSTATGESAQPEGEGSGMVVEKVLRRLGDGRWGEVYEAEVSGVGRAAVKLLADSMIEMEGDIEYSYYDFRREASLQQRCQHPNVVKVYGLAPFPATGNTSSPSYGRPDGSIIMELVPNAQELKHLLRDSAAGGGPHRDFRVGCALDIARALAHVHAQGVIHFDVKPHNILVDETGSCKLSDFGVAWDPRSPPIRYKGRGTIAYMAPELMLSGKPANTKVDVYSFGIMMWELLTGLEPRDDMEYDDIKKAVQQKQRPPIDPNSARRDPAWHDLMTQCWRQPPHARPFFQWIVKSLEKMR